MLITTSDSEFSFIEEDFKFNYQQNITSYLDEFDSLFDQDLINIIVLWKINRYAQFDSQTLKLINSIKKNDKLLNLDKTRVILTFVLKTKGVQIAMASTILRFKNPKIYQIIDQRVYRLIYGKNLSNTNTNKTDINITKQIDVYLKYLIDLRLICNKQNIEFEFADRILYKADKRVNKKIKLSNY